MSNLEIYAFPIQQATTLSTSPDKLPPEVLKFLQLCDLALTNDDKKQITEITPTRLSFLLNNMANQSCIAARLSDNPEDIVAAGGYEIHDDRQELEVTSLAVDPRAQQRGIGSEILKFFARKARERQLGRVVLTAKPTAEEFYRGQGFYDDASDRIPGMWQKFFKEVKTDIVNN